MAQDQVSGGVSVLCWLAATIAMFYGNFRKSSEYDMKNFPNVLIKACDTGICNTVLIVLKILEWKSKTPVPPSKSNQMWNVNTVRWESRNITT